MVRCNKEKAIAEAMSSIFISILLLKQIKVRGKSNTPYPTDIKVAESVINELEKDDEE